MDPPTGPLVDFDTIEQSKENIAPTPRGRSAVALSKAFQPVQHSPHDVRNEHASVRAQFEKDIASSSLLDDPLDVWLRYIKWTDETFPQGQSTESGIARLLERCTEQFKTDKQYTSDPRYLRIWLAYSTYSDSPLDIFAFLQRNEIGQELALYYEEYAAVLERMNRKRKADEIFQMGLLREARPVARLQKRYAEFTQRLQTNPPDPNEPSTPPPPLRTILGASQVKAPAGGTSRAKPKIQVFTDTEEPEVRPGSAGGWENIGTLADRKKENTMVPKPWAGEKLPMRGSTSTATPAERLVVFKDEALQSKRNHEHVAVNLEQIYVDTEEFSFEELLAKKRGLYGLKFEVEKPVSPVQSIAKALVWQDRNAQPNPRSPKDQILGAKVKRSPLQQKSIVEESSPQPSTPPISSKLDSNDDDIVYMPIRDEDSTPRKPLKKRPSPTINTKAALDDIINIFSQPLKSQQELDAVDEDSSSDEESDAASLTSRSFGNRSEIEDADFNGERDTETSKTPITEEPEELEDEVSVVEISEQIATLQLQEETQHKDPEEPSENVLLPSQGEVTPVQEFVFPAQPAPAPSQSQPQPQYPPQRHFKPLPFMTPIEERTESSIFQGSQDDSTRLQSPLDGHFKRPITPPRRLEFERQDLDSSPFEEYTPKPRINTLEKVKRPALQPKKAAEAKKPETKQVGPIIKETQCNPMDLGIRQQIFDALHPKVNTYEGFTGEENRDFKHVPEIERFIAKMTRKECGATQNLEMRIELGGTEYAIMKKLGQGAFAPVFLVEAVGTGELRAIKVEKNPPSKWEFYLMRQAKRRLGVSRAGVSMIDAVGLHLFRDESYLILEYRDQGTILDLVNSAKIAPIGETTTGVMDETLAMFLTIELVRTVEGLHSKNILHGDLKADNCLVRFDEGDLTDTYRRDGTCGWSSKGIALIDFGRGIDTKLFPEKVQFIADWETDDQDCPEMREMRPWTYQVDYWGLAGIIHSMLYGKYITTRTEPVGMGKKRYLLRESLKRYWQQDLWKGLLEVLLNPGLVAAEEGGLPITNKLREWREKMEIWLEANSEKGVGLRGIIRRIESERRNGRA